MTQSKPWLIFIGLALTIIMVDVDMTAANLAVSSITQDLHLSLSNGQWIINGYSMAAAVLMAFAGRCADSFGAKRVFLSALLAFVFASLAVGLAQGFWSITVARIVQGACIAFTFPISMVILRNTFPQEKLGFAISLLISIAGISQSLGPSFGGIMIHYASWRWIFLINIPLAAFAFYLVLTYLREPMTTQKTSLDWFALLLLIVGLFSLMTALNEINRFGLFSYEFAGLILLAILSLAWFIKKELKGDIPLLDIRILFGERFSTLIIIRVILMFTYFSWLFGISLVLQDVLHYSSFDSGFILLSLTLVTAVLAVPVGKLIDVVGPAKIMFAGLCIMLIACLGLTSSDVLQSLIYLIITLVISGLSIALLVPSTSVAVSHNVSLEKMGAGMGVFFTCGFIGNAIGVAISGSLLAEFTIAHGFRFAMILSSVLILIAILLCWKYCLRNESIKTS